MKRNYKKLILLPFLCVVMVLVQGCAKWLDVTESDKITQNDAWQTHAFVSSSVSGAYKLLNEAWRELFLWGEIRADGIDLNTSWNGDDPATPEAFDQIKNINIDPTNKLLAYSRMYQVIGACNTVIKNAPGVLLLDETLTKVQCDRYINEMKWLRSLCYFYLVRTFRDVPYVTEPTMTDANPFAVAKTDGFEILRLLIEELKETTKPNTDGTLPPSYPDWQGWEQRGRATAYSAFALMADIYLWLGEYDEAIKSCEKILVGGSGLYELLEKKTVVVEIMPGYTASYIEGDWFDLFGDGNTEESIFEVQFGPNQNNDLMSWTFQGNAKDIRMLVTDDAIKLFQEYDNKDTVDVRGEGASFLQASHQLYKYQGSQRATSLGAYRRNDGYKNANIIIYRLAEIYLMKAEALIMKGDYPEALDIINNVIRKRAGYSTDQNPKLESVGNENDMLLLLLNEKLREFLGEGKRWFDLTRVAVRDEGKNSELPITVLARQIPVSERENYKDKLREPGFYAFFLPISQEEIDAAGGVLKQNPFYN